MSSESAEDIEKKKKSRQIDAELEEDSRRLRKECKILLLGKSFQAELEPPTDNPKGPAKVESRPSLSR